MKTNTIISIILGVLVLVSVVQAFQLNGMKAGLAEGDFNIKSASSSTPAASSADTGRAVSSVPSSIKNLPKMVGGC